MINKHQKTDKVWCYVCRHAYLTYEPPKDGKCGQCGTDLEIIPTYQVPVPE